MKKLLIVSSMVFIAGLAYASDNCYVWDRGTAGWYACKDQAYESQKMNDRLEQQAQQSTANYEAMRSATAQTDAAWTAQRQAQDERNRSYHEGQ